MSESINTYNNGDVLVYTASLSSQLQGVEIRQPWQLSSFTVLKIRSNTDFMTTLNGVVQNQNFFNETLSTENVGTAGTVSNVSFDTAGLLGLEVVHTIENRDLGQSDGYNNGSAFEEADGIEKDATILLSKHPLSIVAPTNMVQVSGDYSSFDGVIEPFEIRKIIDRTSINLPLIMTGIKASMSITDEKQRSMFQSDHVKIGEQPTAPFLDAQESFAGINQPSAFSDVESNSTPFTDQGELQKFYKSGILDSEMSDVLTSGFVSGSLTYTVSKPNQITSDIIVARHGFVFSQNDNFCYDSIAFGGLKR
jgi:hypothetical protein